MYRHFTGPKKGGMDTDYDRLPYYPIRLRKKLEKGEVEPMNQLSRNQADRYLISRSIKNSL